MGSGKPVGMVGEMGMLKREAQRRRSRSIHLSLSVVMIKTPLLVSRFPRTYIVIDYNYFFPKFTSNHNNFIFFGLEKGKERVEQHTLDCNGRVITNTSH